MNHFMHNALRTQDVIGRVQELQAARSALSQWDVVDVLYFQGPGGIGKTRLLEKFGELASSPNAYDHPIRWSGIVDLYLSATHSNSGIERAICQAIDPKRAFFGHYWDLRRDFEMQRQERVGARELEMLRRRLTSAFIEGFNSLAEQSRVLLTFDTVELVQYENDIVQKICQVPEEAVAVKTWLLDTLPQLGNTVIVFAGRPQSERLDNDLRNAFEKRPGRRYETYKLAGFDEEETARYFAEIIEMARHEGRVTTDIEISPARLYAYTEGRPIRLALLIDLAVHGGSDIEGLFLDEMPAQPSHVGGWQQIAQKVIARIQRMDTGYPIEDTLPYLALTRQGLDADLLHHLEPQWPLVECQHRLDLMKRFTFVKSRPDWPRVYLHDELYDMLDDPQMRFQPIEARIPKWTQIADYYEGQLKSASHEDLQQNLKVDILHYRLRASPRRGFEVYYARWNEEAVKAALVGFDMRLRDEMLRFFQQRDAKRRAAHDGVSQQVVERDSAIRWIKRHINRGDNQKAIQIAEAVLEFVPDDIGRNLELRPSRSQLSPDDKTGVGSTFQTEDRFFWAHLLTYYGEALIYSSQEVYGLSALNCARTLLTAAEPDDESQRWWRQRILGRVFNDLGYAEWIAGRHSAALGYYRRAVRYLREVDLKDELADTINSEAYVYALLGRQYNADSLIEDALHLRRELNLRFPLAMSLNTLATIHALLNRPDEAIHPAEEARAIANELGNRRALGLTALTLGQAYRMQGDRAKRGSYTIENANNLFSKAETSLSEAMDIFVTDHPRDDQVEEPLRRWQALNELGDTYIDWAYALEAIGKSPAEARVKRARAIEYLRQADTVAREYQLTRQMLDTQDDLAQAYADNGDLDTASSHLEQIESTIPAEYRLQPGGFPEVAEPVDEYWLALGKLHNQRAIWVAKRLTESVSGQEKNDLLAEMIREFVVSIAYFEKFSTVAPRLRETLASVYRRIRPLKGERLDHLRTEVLDLQEEYHVDAKRLLLVIQDVAGLREEEDFHG